MNKLWVTRYYVVNENALCYQSEHMSKSLMGVLAGSVLRGGPSPVDGTIAVGDLDKVRDATLQDFEFFRVSPKGHIPI